MEIYSTLMKVLIMSYFFNEMGILNIDLKNINLDNNFDEDDPDAIILIRLSAWHTKFEKRKAFRKKLNKKIMPLAWHASGMCQRMRKKK